MRDVATTFSQHLFQRGAVGSRIVAFELAQLGIDTGEFVGCFASAVRNAPFDPYDPALAAEHYVRRTNPVLYANSEPDWLRCWSSLHESAPLPDGPINGPKFWAERTDGAAAEVISDLKAYRQRLCRRYSVIQLPGMRSWRVTDLGTPAFKQRVSDARARTRRFAALPAELVYTESLLKLLASVCQFIVMTPGCNGNRFDITLHLMLTHAHPSGSKPAPEGMHQDGADYIVSALVLERENVIGGVSVITVGSENGPPAIDSRLLLEGQGIFQCDLASNLWHGVTPVLPDDHSRPAFRSILGLDINFLDKTA